MSTHTPPIVIERPGQGWGGVHPPELGGGGGDNSPDDGYPDYERKLHRARLALLLGLVSITMLFVTITAVFFLREAAVVVDHRTGELVHVWTRFQLPVRLLLLNTLVLLVSSCTMELARRTLARDMILAPVAGIAGISIGRGPRMPWLAITAILGGIFLIGQWMAWEALRAHGFHVFTSGASPFFYLLTGAHAVHLAVGLIILFYAGVISILGGRLEQRRIVVEIASWYWHFMGVLWIYVFVLLQFGR